MASNLTTGCLAQLPAPPAPPRSEPLIEEPPRAPPEASTGRVVFDTEGESAKVSRVTETLVSPGGMQQHSQGAKSQMLAGALGRRQELLCITPCIVDLRQGAHTFVFSSQDDPLRSSTADIAVTSKTTVVRHAIGREASYSGSYIGGAALVLLGSGLTLMGGLATTVGAVGGKDPEPSDASAKGASTSGSSAFLGIGLVTLGIGLVTGTIGAVLMAKNRPVEQAGSTTQWTRP